LRDPPLTCTDHGRNHRDARAVRASPRYRCPLIGTAATSPAPYPPPQPPLNPRAPPPHRSALLRRTEHMRRREATATLRPNPCNPPPQLRLGPRINTEAAIPDPGPRLPRIFHRSAATVSLLLTVITRCRRISGPLDPFYGFTEHSHVDPRDQDDRSCTPATRPREPHPPSPPELAANPAAPVLPSFPSPVSTPSASWSFCARYRRL